MPGNARGDLSRECPAPSWRPGAFTRIFDGVRPGADTRIFDKDGRCSPFLALRGARMDDASLRLARPNAGSRDAGARPGEWIPCARRRGGI